HARQELVDGDVLVQAQELIDDELALLRRVEVLLAQERRPALPERSGLPDAADDSRHLFNSLLTPLNCQRSSGYLFSFDAPPHRTYSVAMAEAEGFDQVLERLKAIVDKLEHGGLSLEESLRVFEEGVALARQGHAILDAAEKRVEMLVRGPEGETI